jgi:hypothetical protein
METLKPFLTLASFTLISISASANMTLIVPGLSGTSDDSTQVERNHSDGASVDRAVDRELSHTSDPAYSHLFSPWSHEFTDVDQLTRHPQLGGRVRSALEILQRCRYVIVDYGTRALQSGGLDTQTFNHGVIPQVEFDRTWGQTSDFLSQRGQPFLQGPKVTLGIEIQSVFAIHALTFMHANNYEFSEERQQFIPRDGLLPGCNQDLM